MYHETLQKLRDFSDHPEFERMVLDILSYLEYPGIDPQSPNLPDGGKDGLYYFSSHGDCVWFAFSLQKRWKSKLKKDFDAAIQSGQTIKKFVYCTNRTIPVLERDKLKNEALENHLIEVDFFDGERLRVALDTVCKDVRYRYLGIADNTVIRRQLRYILLDPESEVSHSQLYKAERVFLTSLAPRGVFELLKSADLSSVCESPLELRGLDELLEMYFTFRSLAKKLETYTLNFVGDQLPGNDYVRFWQVVAAYCIQRAAGWDERTALRISRLQGISHSGEECKKVYSAIKSDDKFCNLVAELSKIAEVCNTSLTKVTSIQSLTEKPKYTA